MMPEMDGLELAGESGRAAIAGVRLMLLTSAGRRRRTHASQALDISACLTKPSGSRNCSTLMKVDGPSEPVHEGPTVRQPDERTAASATRPAKPDCASCSPRTTP